MACCGGRKRVINNMQPISNNGGLSIPLDGNEVLLEYIGTSEKIKTFYGTMTGAQYKAGLSNPYITVDLKDTVTGNMHKPGLLEIEEQGKPVFTQVDKGA